MGSFWDDDDRPTLELDEEDRRQAGEEEDRLRAAFAENRRRVDALFGLYQDVVARYLKYAEAMADGKEKEELKKTLWQLHYRLMQGPVRLLVLGASSAGKSTIVNALAGKVVSPEADQVSTLIPAWIKGVDSTGINQPVCYVLSYGRPEELERTRSQYLQDFCHPPEDRNSKPDGQQYAGEESRSGSGYFAVRVEIQDSFLTLSGITLLDTPGTGQTDTESRMAMETAELGAELLLLATRKNVLGAEETELFRRLICDEKHGLGLCPPKDVFCLFNEGALNRGAYNTNAKDVFEDLTSRQERERQLDLDRRYYEVDVRTERRKREAYLFLDWSPKGSRMGSFKEQQEMQDKECSAHEKLAEEPPSPEMQQLLDDLRRRAWELYADPDRICGPIKRRIQEAAQVLLADCQRGIQEERQRISEEVASLPAEQMTDPDLAILRGELAKMDSSVNYVVKQADALDQDCSSLLHEIQKTANAVSAQSDGLVGKFTENLPNEIPTDAEHMDKEQHGEITESVYNWFIQYQEQWQRHIIIQKLMEQIPDSVARDGIAERLLTILNIYNSMAEEANQYETINAEAYDADAEVREWKYGFQRGIAGCLTHKDTISGNASQLRASVLELLSPYYAEWQAAGSAILFPKKRQDWIRWIYAGSLKAAVREHLNAALTTDLTAYQGYLSEQRELLKQQFEVLRQKIKELAAALGNIRKTLNEQIAAREEFYRGEMHKQLIQERVTPLEEDAARLHGLMDSLNQMR